MKALWENTTTTAKKRLDDLRVSWSDSSQSRDILTPFLFVAEQRRKLEHICREVSDTSDASDNSSEADWRCEEGGIHVLRFFQKSFFLQLYAINQAKDDHKERVDRATEIKNQINKTFAAVLDANAVLQVLADDDTKCQLNQEVEDLREAIKVTEKCSEFEELGNYIGIQHFSISASVRLESNSR